MYIVHSFQYVGQKIQYIYDILYILYLHVYAIQEHDLSHITAQQSHHVWRAPRKTQVTSGRWSHITDIIFWKNSLQASMNPASRIVIFFRSESRNPCAREVHMQFLSEMCASFIAVYIGCVIGCVIVVLHFSNVSIGCLIVFLHRSNVFIDFRKGREDCFSK